MFAMLAFRDGVSGVFLRQLGRSVGRRVLEALGHAELEFTVEGSVNVVLRLLLEPSALEDHSPVPDLDGALRIDDIDRHARLLQRKSAAVPEGRDDDLAPVNAFIPASALSMITAPCFFTSRAVASMPGVMLSSFPPRLLLKACSQYIPYQP